MGSMGTGGYLSAGLQLAQMVAGQQQADKQAQAEADRLETQNRLLTQQQTVQEKQQRDLLQRQLASARARLSAGGVGVGSGSGAALLSGMVRNAEDGIADSQNLMKARQADLLAGYGPRSGASDGLLQGLTLANQGLSLFGQGK